MAPEDHDGLPTAHGVAGASSYNATILDVDGPLDSEASVQSQPAQQQMPLGSTIFMWQSMLASNAAEPGGSSGVRTSQQPVHVSNCHTLTEHQQQHPETPSTFHSSAVKLDENLKLDEDGAAGCADLPLGLPGASSKHEATSSASLTAADAGPATADLTSLPTAVLRIITQHLSYVDAENARLTCQAWRRELGVAAVCDMYLAMCQDVPRAAMLLQRFTVAYPSWNHLHFWIPGRPVREAMGVDGSTFTAYVEAFAQHAPHITALTCHFLDASVCQLSALTALTNLTSLELVDFMPATASLWPLNGLRKLQHLIVEFKQEGGSPDLCSLITCTQLTHLELAMPCPYNESPWELMMAMTLLHAASFWRPLHNLRRLDIRNCPSVLQQEHVQILQLMPQLTHLTLSGMDRQPKDASTPSQPSFKVEIVRRDGVQTQPHDMQLTLVAKQADPHALPMPQLSEALSGTTGEPTPNSGRQIAVQLLEAQTADVYRLTSLNLCVERPRNYAPLHLLSTLQDLRELSVQIRMSSLPSDDDTTDDDDENQHLLGGEDGSDDEQDVMGAAAEAFAAAVQALIANPAVGDDAAAAAPANPVDNAGVVAPANPIADAAGAASTVSASAPAGEVVNSLNHNGGQGSTSNQAHAMAQASTSAASSTAATTNIGDISTSTVGDSPTNRIATALAAAARASASAAASAAIARAAAAAAEAESGDGIPWQGMLDALLQPPRAWANSVAVNQAVSAAASAAAPTFGPPPPPVPASAPVVSAASNATSTATAAFPSSASTITSAVPVSNSSTAAAPSNTPVVGGAAAATPVAAMMTLPPPPPPPLPPGHLFDALRGLRGLTSLSVRADYACTDGGYSSRGSVPHGLNALCASALPLLFPHLHTLDLHGGVFAPHPSSLLGLAWLTALRSLSLGHHLDDVVHRLGVHCLPSSLTSLTLQGLHVVAGPLRNGPTTFPALDFISMKNCHVSDICAFAHCPVLRSLQLEACDVGRFYLPDIVEMWPDLGSLEIIYTGASGSGTGDWQLLSSTSEVAELSRLTRLRKLALVLPNEGLLTSDSLLALTQVRMLSLSPTSHMTHLELRRVAGLRFLAGLEVKLYTDVEHHTELCDHAVDIHAKLQEALPMTDVLCLVDDHYVDDRTPEELAAEDAFAVANEQAQLAAALQMPPPPPMHLAPPVSLMSPDELQALVYAMLQVLPQDVQALLLQPQMQAQLAGVGAQAGGEDAQLGQPLAFAMQPMPQQQAMPHQLQAQQASDMQAETHLMQGALVGIRLALEELSMPLTQSQVNLLQHMAAGLAGHEELLQQHLDVMQAMELQPPGQSVNAQRVQKLQLLQELPLMIFAHKLIDANASATVIVGELLSHAGNGAQQTDAQPGKLMRAVLSASCGLAGAPTAAGNFLAGIFNVHDTVTIFSFALMRRQGQSPSVAAIRRVLRLLSTAAHAPGSLVDVAAAPSKELAACLLGMLVHRWLWAVLAIVHHLRCPALQIFVQDSSAPAGSSTLAVMADVPQVAAAAAASGHESVDVPVCATPSSSTMMHESVTSAAHALDPVAVGVISAAAAGPLTLQSSMTCQLLTAAVAEIMCAAAAAAEAGGRMSGTLSSAAFVGLLAMSFVVGTALAGSSCDGLPAFCSHQLPTNSADGEFNEAGIAEEEGGVALDSCDSGSMCSSGWEEDM